MPGSIHVPRQVGSAIWEAGCANGVGGSRWLMGRYCWTQAASPDPGTPISVALSRADRAHLRAPAHALTALLSLHRGTQPQEFIMGASPHGVPPDAAAVVRQRLGAR